MYYYKKKKKKKQQQQQQQQQLVHWLDCPGTLQPRLETVGTTKTLPLSPLSTVPVKSVALARRTL